MKKVKILSLDGGGIRGIIPGVVLGYLEKRLQQLAGNTLKIGDHFDFISGTSTGGILACTYLIPDKNGQARYSTQDALNLYLKEGSTIFQSNLLAQIRSGFGLFDEKYAATSLEKKLNEIFGDCLLSNFIKPCLITAYEITSRSAYFFTSADAGEDAIYDFKASAIGRATSAAPTYFEPAKIQSQAGQTFYMVDGGVFANNPTLCAYAEARKLKFSELLNDKEKPDFPGAKDMMIVSLGTGSIKKPYRYADLKDAGALGWIEPVIDILMSGNSETVHYQLMQMYNTLSGSAKKNYYRLEPSLREAMPDMDLASTINLENLRQAGLWFVDQNKKMLDEIAKKILEN